MGRMIYKCIEILKYDNAIKYRPDNKTKSKVDSCSA